MKVLSLNGADWRLEAYWINQWRIRPLSAQLSRPMLTDIPAAVPGAIHADLRAAGIIPDWQAGSASFASEWVSNRDWVLKKTVEVPADFAGTLCLEFDGLDYAGSVRIDGKDIGRFEGTHLRHRLELPGVKPGQRFELSLLFEAAPPLDGQIGWTSRTRLFKPRFGYWWDWCSRIINVGIWQDARLVARSAGRFDGVRVLARVDDDLHTGRLQIVGATSGAVSRLRATLTDGERIVCRSEVALAGAGFDIACNVPDVKLWWPATHGDQPLYDLTVELLDSSGAVTDRLERRIGFKHVRWAQNADAPRDAEPYTCVVNGVPIFLRGVNWVPLSPLYGLPDAAAYDTRIRQYRHMNCNLLRVWGGAILERHEFYDACDRHGLLVWQEFPLSSSGLDDRPPDDAETIHQLERIATEYIERRGHHASHLLWCGGNELQKKVLIEGIETSVPVDATEPLMQAWLRRIDRLDPGKRFLVTSSTGPRFYAFAENYGKGLHHDVHGPWANVPLAERHAYWNNDDSLFRSEVGAPGCASVTALERYVDRGIPLATSPPAAASQPPRSFREVLWPPDTSNPAWLIPAATWVPWDEVTREFGPIEGGASRLGEIVKASRYLQAESYRYAAEAARRAWPHRSGFVIWMGHDMLHCTCNNSAIEVDGGSKPAADWLRLAYGPRHVSLRTERFSYLPGADFSGEVWVHAEQNTRPRVTGASRVTARLLDLRGRLIHEAAADITDLSESARVLTLSWPVRAAEFDLFVVTLEWVLGDAVVRNAYLMSQKEAHPLAPLLSLPHAELDVKHEAGRSFAIRNTGDVAAVSVRVACDGPLLAAPNNVLLMPGENATISYEKLDTDRNPHPVSVEWFNQPA